MGGYVCIEVIEDCCCDYEEGYYNDYDYDDNGCVEYGDWEGEVVEDDDEDYYRVDSNEFMAIESMLIFFSSLSLSIFVYSFSLNYYFSKSTFSFSILSLMLIIFMSPFGEFGSEWGDG